jgi:hypothetical protein
MLTVELLFKYIPDDHLSSVAQTEPEKGSAAKSIALHRPNFLNALLADV